MTLDWSKADTSLVHPSGEIKELDVFFQPALAWIPSGTQGVALLFIENATDSPGVDKQDFRELVKSLFRWTWRTAGGGTGTVAQSTLEELYTLFVNNPFGYIKLNSFLGNNFEFHIQECTQDMQGTIFPMFPELSMVIGTGTEQAFSITEEQLDQTGMQAIKDYFNALKVQFDPASTASTARDDRQTITEFIFNDYARVLTRNVLQKAIDYMEGFPDAISKVAMLKVTEGPGITKQPESVKACEGSSASFSVTVSGPNIQYQWQVDEGNGNGFQNISDGGEYTGTGTDSLTVLNPTMEISGQVFQCVVTTDNETLISKRAFLEVTDTAFITSQPKSISVYQSTRILFSVTVSGVNIQYQWQVDDGNGFQDISDGVEYSGTGTDSLTVLNPTLQMSGWIFQCVIATDSGSLVSGEAALKVTETASIINQTDSIEVIEGNNALLSVTVSGVNIQYQWQVVDGNGFQDISDGVAYSGALTDSLTVLNPTLQMSGRIFRCVVTTALTIEDLLTALDTANPYPDIAGMVSRFLMHGLHLPALSYAEGGSAAAQALYQATHQQFTFADAGVPETGTADEYRMTLKDLGDPSIAHFVFPEQDANNNPQIVYTIENNQNDSNPKAFFLELANQMQALDNSDPGLFSIPNPKLIPWYRMQALHFALRKQVEWALSDGSKYLLQLPGSLITHLKLKNPNPTVSIKVWPGGNPNSEAPAGKETFTWATRIDLPIQRITNPETGEYLSQTYAFTGTSEAEKDLLEAVWARDEALHPIHLHLLYAAESGSVGSGIAELPVAAADILLIKANLSNDDADSPTDLFSASFAEDKNFLQLIWEGSTVISGGYYLYFPGITDEVEQALFNGGTTATLQLIIEFTNDDDPIHDFNNAVIFTKYYDLDTNLILAESTEKVPVLAIPPGFLGFQIDDLSEPAADADSAQDEVKNLYQLLGYKIVGHTRFFESNAGLPIGPTAPDPEDSKWLYEKLIPTFSFVSGNTPLPLTDSPPDPYLGVGKDTGTEQEKAELKIELWWQDLYGNKSQPPHLYNETFKVRYTDPLIGINQWPSVTENFEFVKVGDTVMLNILLSFDPSPYALSSHAAASDPATSRKNRVAGDWETYQKIYYQMVQTDISFSVGTSLDLDTSWDFTNNEKDLLVAFIQNCYLYLNDLMNEITSTAPRPFELEINASGITVKKEFIFGVSVNMDVSRDLEYIHDDLKKSKSLKAIAADNSTPGLIFSAKDLVLANDVEVGIIEPGLSLVPANLSVETELFELDPADWDDFVAKDEDPANSTVNTVNTQAGDTLAMLAGRFGTAMTAALGKDVAFSNADLAAILANVKGLLVMGASITVGTQDDVSIERDEDYTNVWAANAILTPKLSQPQATIGSGDTLNTLADGNSRPGSEYTVLDLVLANENETDIIVPNVSLAPAKLFVESYLFELDKADWDDFVAIDADTTDSIDTIVETQTGDTLAMLAARFGTTMTAALGRPVTFSAIDLAAIIGNVTGLLATGALLTLDPGQPPVEVESGETLSTLASANSTLGVSYTAKSLVLANARNTNILNDISLIPVNLTPVETGLFELEPADWDAFVGINTPVSVQAGDTMEVLAARFGTTMTDALGKTVKFSLADLAAVLANVTGLLSSGTSINLGLLNLREFATNFETAFSGLHLAVSEDRNKKNQPADTRRPLYAVQIGANGISVDIKEADPPFYYAIPPLSNTLLSDQVSIDDYATWQAKYLADPTIPYELESEDREDQQFDGIDVNVLARNFLVAVEDFLDPDSLVAAHRLLDTQVENILKQKANLASAISGQVLPILANQSPTATQEGQAKEAIRQQLLLDLVKGYDIETIVQHDVRIDVNSVLGAELDWEPGFEPRLSGKAKVVKVWKGEDPNDLVEIHPRELDFSLSTGQIKLAKASSDSSFTYLFDTKTPEKYANLHFQLEFITSELEYDIEKLTGITAYEASNWLSFLLPEKLTQPMGTAPVPIPLRNYPIPASLIFQQAEPDPTSRTILADVRQWKYTIVYEHFDVAQDSIDCILEINVIEESGLSKSALVVTNLFQALVNFGAVYPLINNDLSNLKEADLFTNDDKKNAAKAGIVAFDALISQIATAWAEWDIIPNTQSPGESDLHYEVSEEPLQGTDKQALVTVIQNLPSKIGGPDPLPTLELPKYKEKKAVVYDPDTAVYTFTYEADPGDLTFFGDSNIPDRKLMVENLDVIEHQNAWAKVWLSRNKKLIFGETTNPAFIFQTPAARFTNMATPFITNDDPWDIATLSATPEQPLLTHLTALIEELFPKPADINYEVRLNCRYAFAMAIGKGLNTDLKPTLPLLMGLRLNPKDDITINGTTQNLLDAYPGMLEEEIKLWFTNHNPSKEEASIIFSINLFSKLNEDSTTSLPMLRIKHLELKLRDVTDL